MVELFAYGKYTRQTQKDRQLATQQIEVLHPADWKKLEQKSNNLIRLGICKGESDSDTYFYLEVGQENRQALHILNNDSGQTRGG